jgi:hypothetical protein
VSTQKAADTDACFNTYGSASVQFTMLVNGTTTAAPLVTLCPVRYTTITDMLTTRATNDTLGAPLRQAQDKLVTDVVALVTGVVVTLKRPHPNSQQHHNCDVDDRDNRNAE